MFETITLQKPKYRMVDSKKNKTIYFQDFDEMLDFVAKGTCVYFYKPVEALNNIYLDYIDLTGYDYVFVYKYDFTKKESVIKAEKCFYMFFDENENILDLRKFSKSIHKRYLDYCELQRHLRAPKYEFRRGPVPGTNKNFRGHYLRSPKTYNEKKKNAVPEYKDYIRSKRKPVNLPDLYDDIPVSFEKSWKTKTKSRKAWAKHEKSPVKRHYEKFKKEYF